MFIKHPSNVFLQNWMGNITKFLYRTEEVYWLWVYNSSVMQCHLAQNLIPSPQHLYYRFSKESSWSNRACVVTVDRKLQIFAMRFSRSRRVHILAGQEALLWQACFVFHTITPHEKTFHNTILCSYVFLCFSLICYTSFPIYFSSVVSISFIPCS